MNIVVTGGAGFIGSHVAEAYLAAGHAVWIVDNLATGKRANVPAGAYFVHADINDAAVRRLLSDERIEAVSHHAAQMSVRHSVADPLFDARSNVLGLLNLLEGAREAGCRTFILASSGGTVYGELTAFPATEEHSTHPLSPYGISKLAGEHYLEFYRLEYGLRTVALRYANIYGPRQDPHGEAGVIAIFSQALLAGQPITINGDGAQTRDYLFVADVVGANLAALTTDVHGPFNVGTGIETDVNALATHLQRLTGATDRAQHGPAKPGEPRRNVLDCGRAARELGWHPKVALEDGLATTVAFFRG